MNSTSSYTKMIDKSPVHLQTTESVPNKLSDLVISSKPHGLVTAHSASYLDAKIDLNGPLSSVVIVDCGSGYSRVANFSYGANNELRVTNAKSYIKALHSVLTDTTTMQEWLTELEQIVLDLDPAVTTVVIGATAGVRDALSKNQVTQEKLTTFTELLNKLPFQTTLDVLSGDDEAMYEHKSASYCAHHCGYVPHSTEQDIRIGLLSSGGMSSQVHFEGLSLSIDTLIKHGNALGEQHGMEEGTRLFHDSVNATVEAVLDENFGHHAYADVLFLAIEMFGAVGERAGMKGAVVSGSEAIQNFTDFVELQKAEDAKLGPEVSRNWKTYVHVMSGIMAIAVLKRLHADAKILFLREYTSPEGHVYKPSWCLGHAIATLAASS